MYNVWEFQLLHTWYSQLPLYTDLEVTANLVGVLVGEGNGNPLQCPCLENPRDGGAWWAAVYGVAQSQTLLKRLSSSSGNHKVLCYVVRPFLFGKEVHLYPLLEFTTKWYHMILAFVSLRLLWSSPLPYCWMWCDVILLWLSNNALSACTPSCLPIHLSLST